MRKPSAPGWRATPSANRSGHRRPNSRCTSAAPSSTSSVLFTPRWSRRLKPIHCGPSNSGEAPRRCLLRSKPRVTTVATASFWPSCGANLSRISINFVGKPSRTLSAYCAASRSPASPLSPHSLSENRLFAEYGTNSRGRYFIVGDIHGEHRQLLGLLDTADSVGALTDYFCGGFGRPWACYFAGTLCCCLR